MTEKTFGILKPDQTLLPVAELSASEAWRKAAQMVHQKKSAAAIGQLILSGHRLCEVYIKQVM